MGFSETIFLFFLALIIFGPKKLPEIARQVGKALNEFRRASNEFKAQIEQEISNLERESPSRSLPATTHVEGAVSHSMNSEAVAESIPPEPVSAATESTTPSDPVTVASPEIVSDTNREPGQSDAPQLEAPQLEASESTLAGNSLTATSPQGSHV